MVDIYLDSKRIKKNDLYISLKGLNNDGILYLDEVIEKGGNLLYSDNLNYSYYPNLKKDLNNILINHYKVNFNYKIIGITGTNKKTSTAYLITKALNKYGYKAKCISTIIDNDTYYSSLTTPRNDDLIRIFKKAELENLDFLIMEVSSIGIDEFRVNNIKFDLGILTNLESDHLDYHNDVFSLDFLDVESKDFFESFTKELKEFSLACEVALTNNDASELINSKIIILANLHEEYIIKKEYLK